MNKKQNIFGYILTGILSLLTGGFFADIAYGNYYIPILEISEGSELKIIPNSYSVGEEIFFHIPIHANSGSSSESATLYATLYHDDSEIITIERIIDPEKPVLFSIPVIVVAKDPPRDEFKLEFVYEATNDEPWYKGDVPYYYEGEIFGYVEVKNP